MNKTSQILPFNTFNCQRFDGRVIYHKKTNMNGVRVVVTASNDVRVPEGIYLRLFNATTRYDTSFRWIPFTTLLTVKLTTERTHVLNEATALHKGLHFEFISEQPTKKLDDKISRKLKERVEKNKIISKASKVPPALQQQKEVNANG